MSTDDNTFSIDNNLNLNNNYIENNNINNLNQIDEIQNDNIHFQVNSDSHSNLFSEQKSIENSENQSDNNNSVTLNIPQSNSGSEGGIFTLVSISTIYGFIKEFGYLGINIKLINLNEFIYRSNQYKYYSYIKYDNEQKNGDIYGNVECLGIFEFNKEDPSYFPEVEKFKKSRDLIFKGKFWLDHPLEYQSQDIILEVKLSPEEFKFDDRIIKGDFKIIFRKQIGNESIYDENEIGENIELIYENGNFYKGTMVNFKADGIGEMKCSNGDEYKGGFIKDKYDGKGELKFKNGSEYKGGFKEGMFNGDGIFFDSSDNKKYVVKYKDGNLLSKTLV